MHMYDRRYDRPTFVALEMFDHYYRFAGALTYMPDSFYET